MNNNNNKKQIKKYKKQKKWFNNKCKMKQFKNKWNKIRKMNEMLNDNIVILFFQSFLIDFFRFMRMIDLFFIFNLFLEAFLFYFYFIIVKT